MQRLTRLDKDRGAVAVWVAILMVPLLAAAALAIDVGAAHADRQRLQHGADAAALAIAQQCAAEGCGDADATAQELADANGPQGGPVTATVLELDEGLAWVEVETTSSRDFWFAPVIGVSDTSLSARGAASWNQIPTAGSHLPLAISWCEVAHWAGLTAEDMIWEDGELVGLDIPSEATDVVLFSKGHQSAFHECPDGTNPQGPNGLAPSGGFGWLTSDGDCETATSTGGWFESSTGRPETCGGLADMIGRTVLVPVFSETRDEGANADYRVFGYIGFTLEGYRNNMGSAGTVPSSCTANSDCIFGTIERFVELGDDFSASPDGPQLGASLVELRLPEEG